MNAYIYLYDMDSKATDSSSNGPAYLDIFDDMQIIPGVLLVVVIRNIYDDNGCKLVFTRTKICDSKREL
jgi:hypothetical protein